MANNNDNWTPRYVRNPANKPPGRTCFDWTDPKLLKWRNDAIKMQDVHVRDNNHTEWFAYLPDERDAIELRILMVVYGLRVPKVEIFKVF